MYNVYAKASCKDVDTALLVAEREFGDHLGIVKSRNGWSEPSGRTVRNDQNFLTDEKLRIAQGENFGTTSPGRAKGFTFSGPNAHARLNAINKLVPVSPKIQERVRGLPLSGRGSKLFSGIAALGLISTFQNAAKAEQCCTLIDRYNKVARNPGDLNTKHRLAEKITEMTETDTTFIGQLFNHSAPINIPDGLQPIPNPFDEFRRPDY